MLLDKDQPNDLSSVFPLARLLKEYQKLHALLVGLNRQSTSERQKDKLTKSQFLKASFQYVKGAVSAPLVALTRNVPGPLNQLVGSAPSLIQRKLIASSLLLILPSTMAIW